MPSDRQPQSLNLLPTDTIEIDAPIEASRIRRGETETGGLQALAAIETSLECEILGAGGFLPLILTDAL